MNVPESCWSRYANCFIPTEGMPQMPLLVLLHGGGGTTEEHIAVWKPLAQREKVILLAPKSLDGRWGTQQDAQNVFDACRYAAADLAVNRKKIYLAGHSLGGAMALGLTIFCSNFFAAAAAHSPTETDILDMPIDPARWQTRVKIWVGSERFDENCNWGRSLQQFFKKMHNIDVGLAVVEGHRHNEYAKLIPDIWSFLKDQRLGSDPNPAW